MNVHSNREIKTVSSECILMKQSKSNDCLLQYKYSALKLLQKVELTEQSKYNVSLSTTGNHFIPLCVHFLLLSLYTLFIHF